jgi:hypothetical protein
MFITERVKMYFLIRYLKHLVQQRAGLGWAGVDSLER